MNPERSVVLLLLLTLIVSGCQPRTQAAEVAAGAAASNAAVTDWEALMPEAGRNLRPPPVIGGMGLAPQRVPGGLIDDSGSGTVPGMAIDHSSPDRAQQFGSTDVVAAMEGREVALDGYVVPLDSDDEGRVKEVLFVPFYGACIHVPPPPPNQIVHVVLATPMPLPALWDAFHLSGTLHLARFHADIANASYEVVGGQLQAVPG